MNWDERYREASLKDWADKQRTKRITREFQNVSKEDAYKNSKKMVDYHNEMAKHHEDMADFLTEGRDEPHWHYYASNLHKNAREAHGLVISLLENPHVNNETRWDAINHATGATNVADQMTEEQRSLLDPQDDEEE